MEKQNRDNIKKNRDNIQKNRDNIKKNRDKKYSQTYINAVYKTKTHNISVVALLHSAKNQECITTDLQ